MRLAVAHRSTASLKAIQLALSKAQGCEVLWTASDADGALQAAHRTPPALLLLDAHLANPSSVAVARKLQGVCSVLLLTDDSPRAMSLVYDGMVAGALDVAACPTLSGTGQLVGEGSLLAKLRSLESVLEAPVRRPLRTSATRIVLIGCSTGGPQALQVILSRLPRDLNAAFVIAQHVDVEFSGGLADWLNRETKLSVRVASHDSEPTACTVLIAGTNDHLVLSSRRRLVYTKHPIDAPYRPSADALFASFAEHWPQPGLAVLLTGMGKDGGQGMLKLRQAGWRTIAQDAATSVVFGMPRAAIELGAAQDVLPLSAIGDAIVRSCTTVSRTAG